MLQKANKNYARSEKGKKKSREANNRFVQKKKNESSDITSQPSTDTEDEVQTEGAAQSRVMTRARLANERVQQEEASNESIDGQDEPSTDTEDEVQAEGVARSRVMTRGRLANERVQQEMASNELIDGQDNFGSHTRVTTRRQATEQLQTKTAAAITAGLTKPNTLPMCPVKPKAATNVSQVTTRRKAMGVITRREAMGGKKHL